MSGTITNKRVLFIRLHSGRFGVRPERTLGIFTKSGDVGDPAKKGIRRVDAGKGALPNHWLRHEHVGQRRISSNTSGREIYRQL